MLKRTVSLAVLAVVVGMVLVAAGCKKAGVVEEGSEPPVSQTEIPVPSSVPPLGDASITPQPVRVVHDQDVGERWSAVEITVTEKDEAGREIRVQIPLRGETAVEGTPLTIRVLGFVPDFTMDAERVATKSLDDKNPAVKIQILEGEESLFEGWAFRDFPGMHPFDDPRYSVLLTKAIPAE